MSFRVAFLGFSEFERSALASYFRLAVKRTPTYQLVLTLTDADYLVADADHAPSVQLVLATERGNETVFIGAHAPPGCTAWMTRPIDALHVMRELDAMVAQRSAMADPPQAEDDAPEPVIAVERAALIESAAPPEAPLGVPKPVTLAKPAALPAAAPRALLVDDSELALRFLESKLGRWRMDIDRAASSTAALELMARHSYDFVFLDVELGEGSEMDGLALCQQIKHSPSAMNAAVVLVSAHHSEMDRVRGAMVGCDAYLGKPLEDVELQRLLLRQGLRLPKDESAPQT